MTLRLKYMYLNKNCDSMRKFNSRVGMQLPFDTLNWMTYFNLTKNVELSKRMLIKIPLTWIFLINFEKLLIANTPLS